MQTRKNNVENWDGEKWDAPGGSGQLSRAQGDDQKGSKHRDENSEQDPRQAGLPIHFAAAQVDQGQDGQKEDGCEEHETEYIGSVQGRSLLGVELIFNFIVRKKSHPVNKKLCGFLIDISLSSARLGVCYRASDPKTQFNLRPFGRQTDRLEGSDED